MISISGIAIVLLFFSSNIMSFLQKTQLTSTILTFYEDEPKVILLDPKDYMLAIQIEQTAFNVNPYFNLTLEQRTYYRLDNGTQIKKKTYINLIPCTLDRFQSVFSKYDKNFTLEFNRLQLEYFLCPDPGTIFSLGGTFTSVEFNFMKIEVTPCKTDLNSNFTWKPKCATEEEKQNHLSSTGQFRIQLYMINQIVNPTKAGQDYIQPFLDDTNYFSFVPTKLQRQANMYFKSYQFQNDESITPLEDIEYHDINVMDQNEMRDLTELGRDTDTSYAAFYLRRSPITIQVIRSYQKVTQLLSYLGGFLQIVFVCMGIFVAMYNRLQVLISLANKLFEFQHSTNQKHFIKHNQMKIVDQALEQIKTNTQTNQVDTEPMKILMQHNTSGIQNQIDVVVPLDKEELDDKEEVEVYQQENLTEQVYEQFNINLREINSGSDYFKSQMNQIITRSKPLQLTLKLLLNRVFCGKVFNSNESKLFNKALNKITENLDASYILEKLNELEKLKSILLTKEQLIMFNFTPKPLISLRKNMQLPSRTQFEQSAKSIQTLSIVSSPQKVIESIPRKRGSLFTNNNMYLQVYKAYETLLNQIENNIDTTDRGSQSAQVSAINEKLLKRLGIELQTIFKVSKLIDYQSKPKCRKFVRMAAHHEDDEDDDYFGEFQDQNY